LTDSAAKREAIIASFRQLRQQIHENDVVLFYFSGHGSQQQAPPELWHAEPDRLNETLVCWDSRTEGGWDLADKELAGLIAEVAESGAHILVILDCCHSGSGTRGESHALGARGIPLDERQRPWETFFFATEASGDLVSSRSIVEPSDGWFAMPSGRHVALTACQDRQLAFEYYGGGEPRGAFSYFLFDTLQRAKSDLTYRDLFKRAESLVRNAIVGQSPQLEAIHNDDLDLPFLGGTINTHTGYFTASYHRDRGWIIDGGQVHGIPPVSDGATATLALFSFDTPVDRLRDLSAAWGKASVVEIFPHASTISIEAEVNPDPTLTFKAIVIDMPLSRLPVHLEGDELGVALARQALFKALGGVNLSPHLRVDTDSTEAAFRLLARNGAFQIIRPGDARVIARIDGFTAVNAALAIRQLERIACWTNIAQLSNPSATQIRDHDITIEIFRGAGGERAGSLLQKKLLWSSALDADRSEIRAEYTCENGDWEWPRFEVRLTNRRVGGDPLYCALLALSEDYTITSLLPGESVRLGSEEMTAIHMGGNVSDKLWAEGITECRDMLKLIVCTEQFDATLLEQGQLDTPQASRSAGLRGPLRVLAPLIYPTSTRALVRLPDVNDQYDDWMTREITIATIRPLEAGARARDGRGSK